MNDAPFSLTEHEKFVIDLLKQTADTFENQIIIRIVGGWVRDKLLHHENDDIDITVENVSCVDFSKRLINTFPSIAKSINFPNVSHAACNELKLVQVQFFDGTDLDVCDIVGYDGMPPSAESDCIRRDVTINSLFYNIRTNSIEDYCGGLQDIQNKIIRTTVDTKKSFEEDNDRVIRAFRFSAKFGFNLSPDIISIANSITNREISTGLRIKELEKGFSGPNVTRFIKMLIDSDWFKPVLGDQKWNYDLIIDKVQRIEDRNPPIENRFRVVLAGLLASLEEGGIKITRRMAINISLGTKAYEISEGYKTIPHELEIVNVGEWIKECGNKWRDTFYLVNNEDEYQFCINQLLPFIEKENIGDVWEAKYLLNGEEVQNLFRIRPGKEMKEKYDILFQWQLLNRDGTKEDFYQYVQSNSLAPVD